MIKWNWRLCQLSIVAVCIVFICGFGQSQIPQAASGERADIIHIDAMKVFGTLEKPPVEFLHDGHSQALALIKGDCTTCHLSDNDRLSPKFKRLTDTDKTTVMNLYHNGCISCHGEMKIAGKKTGPVECDDCHIEKSRFSSSRHPMEFDKSLHFQHIEMNDQNCVVCHHDGKKEVSCRYCHKDDDTKKAISLKAASHFSCIGCHRELSGPSKCNECHDINEQQKIVKSEDIPRLNQGQPDFVLLGADLQTESTIKLSNKMNPVPFDHKVHEGSQNTCRSCHHESQEACTTCHTTTGSIDGKGVRLETAMHDINSKHSCRGCHLEQQKNSQCAGCHGFMDGRLENKSDSCRPCHMQPPEQMPTLLNEDDKKAFAAQMLLARGAGAGTYRTEDVPETVIISALSKKYTAVEFPHRRIINALAGQTRQSKLAAYFHTDPGNLCQGCHHNSPTSQKPPSCRNCHNEQLSREDMLKPGIMGAYHLQCMGCHKQMGIEKPAGCTDCHKKR